LLAITILIASGIGQIQFYTPLKMQNLNSLCKFVDEQNISWHLYNSKTLEMY